MLKRLRKLDPVGTIRKLSTRLKLIDPVVGFFTGTIAVFFTPMFVWCVWRWIADWWDPLDDLFSLGMDG